MPEVPICDVTVVVLAHNGEHFTRRCLPSILRSNPLPRQVIAVNNGSTDGTAAVLEAFSELAADAGVDFLTWRNDSNVGCSEARNQAWERAAGEFVVFLDNDTVVHSQDWLAVLLAAMHADAQLAIISPKLVYPYEPHFVQCAGVAINPMGRVRFRGRGASRNADEYAEPTVVPALISACWLMRSRLLQEVGGLDPLFHPVQYEDLDLCLRANQAGYHCMYTPHAEIYHFEGGTTAAISAEEYQRNIVMNSTKFRRKWLDVIKDYPDDEADYRWQPQQSLGLTDVLAADICPPL